MARKEKLSNELTELLSRLQLVNYRTHQAHDGYGMNADLKYNGVKIAHLYDDGWGGEIRCDAIGKFIKNDKGEYVQDKTLRTNNELLRKLNDEIEQLPPWGYEGKQYPYHLDTVIGELECLTQVRKDEKKGILIERVGGHAIIKWHSPIPKLLEKYRDSLNFIQEAVDEAIADGETILNVEYLKSIGIKFK